MDGSPAQCITNNCILSSGLLKIPVIETCLCIDDKSKDQRERSPGLLNDQICAQTIQLVVAGDHASNVHIYATNTGAEVASMCLHEGAASTVRSAALSHSCSHLIVAVGAGDLLRLITQSIE